MEMEFSLGISVAPFHFQTRRATVATSTDSALRFPLKLPLYSNHFSCNRGKITRSFYTWLLRFITAIVFPWQRKAEIKCRYRWTGERKRDTWLLFSEKASRTDVIAISVCLIKIQLRRSLTEKELRRLLFDHFFRSLFAPDRLVTRNSSMANSAYIMHIDGSVSKARQASAKIFQSALAERLIYIFKFHLQHRRRSFAFSDEQLD